MARRYTYRRMTAAQLSAALDAVTAVNGERFSKGRFIRLTGMSYQKVGRMLAGAEGADIPHSYGHAGYPRGCRHQGHGDRQQRDRCHGPYRGGAGRGIALPLGSTKQEN